MDNTLDALRALYVAAGGSLDDVKNLVLIPDLINAIALKVALIVTAAGTKELPDNPTANGTYALHAVKSNSGTTLSWASTT